MRRKAVARWDSRTESNWHALCTPTFSGEEYAATQRCCNDRTLMTSPASASSVTNECNVARQCFVCRLIAGIGHVRQDSRLASGLERLDE
jgi:DNA topoisomerase IB